MRILLTEQGVQALNAPVIGYDEFAELLRRMHTQLMGNMLMVTSEDWDLLRHFADGRGSEEVAARAHAILDGAEKG